MGSFWEMKAKVRERDSILEIWGVSTSLQDRDGEQEQRGCNTKENFVVTKGEREWETRTAFQLILSSWCISVPLNNGECL